MDILDEYLALESIGCIDLFDDIIATESMGLTIKESLKKLKEWFIKICKAFWEKIKAFYYRIKKKHDPGYKTPKEKYDQLMKACDDLQKQNTRLKEQNNEISESSNDNFQRAVRLAGTNRELRNIISEMEKNHTTLQTEKDNIEKEYKLVKDGMDEAINEANSIFKDVWELVEGVAGLNKMIQSNLIDNDWIDATSGRVDRVIERIDNSLNFISSKYDNYDVNMIYFKGSLKSLCYLSFEEEGSALSYSLKNLRNIQDNLTTYMNKDLTTKEQLDAAYRIAQMCSKAMAEVTKCMNL